MSDDVAGILLGVVVFCFIAALLWKYGMFLDKDP